MGASCFHSLDVLSCLLDLSTQQAPCVMLDALSRCVQKVQSLVQATHCADRKPTPTEADGAQQSQDVPARIGSHVEHAELPKNIGMEQPECDAVQMEARLPDGSEWRMPSIPNDVGPIAV
ncbi:hypothetical protein [Streptomyces sp. NPDC054854]